MKKFFKQVWYGLKIFRLFIKSNGLYNFDLFLSLAIAEWLKFYLTTKGVPITSIEDLNDIEKTYEKFTQEANMVIRDFTNYYNAVTSGDFDNISINLALNWIVKYFRNFWV